MPNYYVIEQIEIGICDDDGPVVKNQNEKHQEIHLAQGSMDGACGPYSLMMALLICGLIDREDLIDLKSVDRRTKPGKLLNLLQQYQGLFRNGTNTKELKKMLSDSYKKVLSTVSPKEEKLDKDLRIFIKNHLELNHPVILWLTFSGSDGHWVVVVGYEYDKREEFMNFESVEAEWANRIVNKFLLLDPGEDAPTVSAWNGIVDAVGTGGQYPYKWWGNNDKVKFYDALALCPK